MLKVPVRTPALVAGLFPLLVSQLIRRRTLFRVFDFVVLFNLAKLRVSARTGILPDPSHCSYNGVCWCAEGCGVLCLGVVIDGRSSLSSHVRMVIVWLCLFTWGANCEMEVSKLVQEFAFHTEWLYRFIRLIVSPNSP